MTKEKKHVAVIGGGLVGALNACFFAQRGFKVDLYEYRSDIRTQQEVRGRSINLALSCRGRSALKAVGLEDEVMKLGLPMYGRMIHNTDSTCKSIPYGTKDQYITSIDRRKLNEILLTCAEKYPDVTFHFHAKFDDCNFETGELTCRKSDGTLLHNKVDLIVGCDGAYSAVRRKIMKNTRFDYKQEYIPHGYMELNMPPTADQQFAMADRHLHIWPRNTFMMIALPNLERSFTVTLFMPFTNFEAITTKEQVLEFFEKTFPDSVPLLGRDALAETYLNSKGLPMVTVKCSPYHVGDKGVIMGDAAHAMVPFYGQGMNCGFEDCLVLNELLDKYDNDLSVVLPEYTRIRNPDAKAMCDLAVYNYFEMRAHVNSRYFLIRKHVDNFLHWLFPKGWIPLYTMVSFTRTRYHECISRKERQDKIIDKVMKSAALVSAMSAGALLLIQWRPAFFTKLYEEMPKVLLNKLSFN